MLNIIGIRFQSIGKIYHFDASVFKDIRPGDFVIVETSRGKQLGEVVQLIKDPPPPPGGKWKPVKRKATPKDLVLNQVWKQREAKALATCQKKAQELNLVNVKFFAAEYNYDGTRLSFLYSVEEGEKIDFTPLRRALLRVYPRIQLDLHQIGPRDVAKLLGGMGACGLSCRCCSMFLTDFNPISIKMAKEQGVSLTPTEITGMCGRLRCCLIYEYQQYVEARKYLPKRKKRVVTPKGEGRVLDLLPLQDSVIVELEKGIRQTFHRMEIEPWDEVTALRRKAEQFCPQHPAGGCNCRQQADSGDVVDDEPLAYDGEAVVLSSAPPAPKPSDEKKPRRRSKRRRSSSHGKDGSRSKQSSSSSTSQKSSQQKNTQQSGQPKKQSNSKSKQKSSQRRRSSRQSRRPRRSGSTPASQDNASQGVKQNNS